MTLAKLILAEPLRPKQHCLLQQNPFVIGRSNDCDLPIDRTGISKRHARIVFDGETFMVEDLQSKNGTIVNGKRIGRARTLEPRDVISIGGVDLTFETVRQEQWNKDVERNLIKFKAALKFTKSLAGNPYLDPILDDIMQALMRLSQAERGFLMIGDDYASLQIARTVNIDVEEVRSKKFQLSMTAVEKAIETGQAVAVSNALDDTFFRGHTSVQELELKTLVCVPIVADQQRVTGILYADSNRKEQELTQLDLEVLESLAASASIAIENAKLHSDISRLIQDASGVLQEVESKGHLDEALQDSIRRTLDSFSLIKQKRSRNGAAGHKPVTSLG